jgi:hypothetical protein
MGKLDPTGMGGDYAIVLACRSRLIFNLAQTCELMLGVPPPESLAPGPPPDMDPGEKPEVPRLAWTLGVSAPEARADARRMLADGDGPVPLYFIGRDSGMDAYVFEIKDGFEYPRGSGSGVDVRDRWWLRVRLQPFLDGVLRAFGEARFDRALNPRRHPGLRQLLARWTGGADWIDQEL